MKDALEDEFKDAIDHTKDELEPLEPMEPMQKA
jgi:hypothetical protein